MLLPRHECWRRLGQLECTKLPARRKLAVRLRCILDRELFGHGPVRPVALGPTLALLTAQRLLGGSDD